jgi:hypothetical protein
MKKSKDLLEGRTKEWDTKDWQGKSKKQIEFNETVVFITLILFGLIGMGFAIYNVFI